METRNELPNYNLAKWNQCVWEAFVSETWALGINERWLMVVEIAVELWKRVVFRRGWLPVALARWNMCGPKS